MAIEQALYTAHATATGGRAGSAESSDGALKATLTTPKELGGDGAFGTNPEQLFAAGYAACFIGALKAVAGRQKLALPKDVSIQSSVGIGAHNGITVPDPPLEIGRLTKAIGRVGWQVIELLRITRGDQQDRVATVCTRAVDVRRNVNAVAHRNA